MKNSSKTVALAVTAVLIGSATCIEAPAAPADAPIDLAPVVRPPRPATPHPPQQAAPAIPQPEPSLVTSPNAGFASFSVFSSATSNTVTPDAQTLSGPVTLSYSGSSPAFSITDSGTNRGLTASITNTHDASSALYGDTVGGGAGLTGFNLGTGGPGGKFQVTNANSTQPGAFASTNGTGPALLGTITNTNSDYPAIYGQNLASNSLGYGVRGDGNVVGVYGYVPSSSKTTAGSIAIFGSNDSNTTPGLGSFNYGVYGGAYGNGIGVGASAVTGYGVFATSNSNYAVRALTLTGTATIYAENDSTSASASGVFASIENGSAIEGIALAQSGTGVNGKSTNGYGVQGYDMGGGVGVYGSSKTGYAGIFAGNVNITGELTVGTTVYTSDRNLKSDIRPIDGKDVLARVSDLPISSWHYTSAPEKRHVGPMAQDFHAAFGLNGADDTHISEVDIAGVSLAAIQELNSEMKIKDAQIAELRAKAAELNAKVAAFEGQTAELKAQTAEFKAQTAELKAQAAESKAQVAKFEARTIAQAQAAMAHMQQTFSARMTALERRADSTQTVAVERSTQQRGAMD